jgi:hypothetical protein
MGIEKSRQNRRDKPIVTAQSGGVEIGAVAKNLYAAFDGPHLGR